MVKKEPERGPAEKGPPFGGPFSVGHFFKCPFFEDFWDLVQTWPKQNLMMRQSFAESFSLSSRLVLAIQIQRCKVYFFTIDEC